MQLFPTPVISIPIKTRTPERIGTPLPSECTTWIMREVLRESCGEPTVQHFHVYMVQVLLISSSSTTPDGKATGSCIRRRPGHGTSPGCMDVDVLTLNIRSAQYVQGIPQRKTDVGTDGEVKIYRNRNEKQSKNEKNEKKGCFRIVLGVGRSIAERRNMSSDPTCTALFVSLFLYFFCGYLSIVGIRNTKVFFCCICISTIVGSSLSRGVPP